jgi:isopentenyl diphosphate isomerase/L-lactate dehydrogenase-like FMN-dependent dehydrogenase
MKVSLLNDLHQLALPVCLSPTAFHMFAHPDGEKATARGEGGGDGQKS